MNPVRRGTATITSPSVVCRRRIPEEHDRGSGIEPQSTALHSKGLQTFRRRQRRIPIEYVGSSGVELQIVGVAQRRSPDLPSRVRLRIQASSWHSKGHQTFRRQALNFGSVVKSSSRSPKRFPSDDHLLTVLRFDPATADRRVFPLFLGDSLSHCFSRRLLLDR